MEHLLTSYSINEILLVLVIAAIAIKQLITFFDWAKKRTKQSLDKDSEPEIIKEKLDKFINICLDEIKRLDQIRDVEIARLEQNEGNIQQLITVLDDKLNRLVLSDRDDIKSWITAQHHFFMEKGQIDYYSLDCINRRYEHYKAQGGNTFVDDLMTEINSLPKIGSQVHVYL